MFRRIQLQTARTEACCSKVHTLLKTFWRYAKPSFISNGAIASDQRRREVLVAVRRGLSFRRSFANTRRITEQYSHHLRHANPHHGVARVFSERGFAIAGRHDGKTSVRSAGAPASMRAMRSGVGGITGSASQRVRQHYSNRFLAT